ncbi:Sodium hydrogen exchanger [Fragilaria crotonensis]|nr:Sodium hydrogen exchanger [Fragilaria crotonensis]
MDLSRRLTTEADVKVEVEVTSEEGKNASISSDMSSAQMEKEEFEQINDEEEDKAIDEVETELIVPDVTATKKPKPKQSLTLPTANQHVSDTMLGETLLLQKEDTIQKVFDSIVNQTNVTLNNAAVDAAASSKAVQEVTAAVSAVLNDPTSVEARICCASILNVFHENCDTPDEEVVSDKKLFLIVFVLAFCGMVKSLIRHFQIRWLPEAAGCILVGVLCGAILSFVPHYDISFDGDWFLRIMVPPIVFEAALSINKRSFNRHIWPIMIYAVAGTLLATCMTAFVLHQGTSMLSGCETIPYVESLTFGALISSIDPIAVLSVLNNMGMTDSDSIYVVIFGESLLNDGVALVLFETLVHFLDESLVIDEEAVIAAAIHCCVVAFGSLCVGVVSGFACSFYYWMMKGCQTPLVEVLLFFCWAFIPYYICDGIGWSGIVAIVSTGFVMDLFVVGEVDSTDGSMQTSRSHGGKASLRRSFFNVHGHLSLLARTHVGFVAELLSTMMETAIFAYLGVFLFSYRYHWNFLHTFLAIFACCISRAVMIPLLSLAANSVARVQQARAVCQKKKGRWSVTSTFASHPSPGVIIDKKMQLVLWVAGLRGAMSFALVENIPLYDTVTQQGHASNLN